MDRIRAWDLLKLAFRRYRCVGDCKLRAKPGVELIARWFDVADALRAITKPVHSIRERDREFRLLGDLGLHDAILKEG
jgi:hypothetical protein